MFLCAEPQCSLVPRTTDWFACETCYRDGKHPQSHLVKINKHCCLLDLRPQSAAPICKCPQIQWSKRAGEIFPVDRNDPHEPHCGLLRLGEHIAMSKGRSVLSAFQRRKLRRQITASLVSSSVTASHTERKASKASNLPVTSLSEISKEKTELRIKAAEKSIVEACIVHSRTANTPPMLRPVTDRIAFGNTHMSLMFGPLIIENGVPG